MLVLWVYNFNNTPALFTWRGIQLPPTVLPVLLLLASEILPSSSFWCNFCGLALGYGYVQGLLERMQLSLHAVRAIEAWPLIRQTTKWSGFVDSPESASLPTVAPERDRQTQGEQAPARHYEQGQQHEHASPLSHPSGGPVGQQTAEYASTTAL